LITEITNISSRLIAYQYPNHLAELSDLMQPVGDRFPQAYTLFQNSVTNLTSMLLNFSKQIFASIINSGKLLFNITTLFLITPILTFYLCLDIKKIKQSMRKLPPKNLQQDVKQLFQSINNVIAKFFRGQLMVCLIFASYYSAMFSLLGINSAVALGALTGFSLFIPLIGIFTSLIITAIITYITMHSFSILAYLAIIFAIGIILESTIVTPKLIGKTLSLHPLWIFLGLFCGGTLFGFFGILFALPLTAVTSVFIRFIIQKYKNSKIYNY
jgi:predicted PurR-regulated permease PerM